MEFVRYKELVPVRPPHEEFEQIEKLLDIWFRKEIFLPLIKELNSGSIVPKKVKLDNAIDRDVLLEAIRTGKVYYYRGVFKGSFNAQITKEMMRLKGVWDAKESGFRVLRSQIPYPIQHALADSETAFMRLVERLDKKLSELLPAKFAELIPLEKIFEKLIYKVDGDVQQTLKGISIQPKLSAETIAKIADPYVGQTRADIKDWTEENMAKLREEIKNSVLRGERNEAIAKHIQDTYGVSQNKAKFLARNETSLMTSKLKEERYAEAEVFEYRWSCVKGSPNHPVRPYHEKNNNQVFRFDSPPTVNKKGDRKNPGEDYNCRCNAIPIVRF